MPRNHESGGSGAATPLPAITNFFQEKMNQKSYLLQPNPRQRIFQPHSLRSMQQKSKHCHNLDGRTTFISQDISYIKPYATCNNGVNQADYFTKGREFYQLTYFTRTRTLLELSSKKVPLLTLLAVISLVEQKQLREIDLKTWFAYLELVARREGGQRLHKCSKPLARELLPLLPKRCRGRSVTRLTLEHSLAKLKSHGLLNRECRTNQVKTDILASKLSKLGQKYLTREVWLGRPQLRDLAKTGSLAEMVCFLLLFSRRMAARFFRARLSITLVQSLTGLSRGTVFRALKSLRARKVVRVSPIGNEHWLRWHNGYLYDFATDLSFDGKPKIITKTVKQINPKPVGDTRPIKPYKQIAIQALIDKGTYKPPKKKWNDEKQVTTAQSDFLDKKSVRVRCKEGASKDFGEYPDAPPKRTSILKEIKPPMTQSQIEERRKLLLEQARQLMGKR